MDSQTTNPEDEIRAQNAVLRLKLEMDYGLEDFKPGGLSPWLENWCLNQILLAEKHRKKRRPKRHPGGEFFR